MKVATVKIRGQDRVEAFQRLFSHLNFPERAGHIVIKLNLCDYRKPDSGAVSDPVVVEALLAVLREKFPAARILLCENDASDTLVHNTWRYIGMDTVAEKYGAVCVNLSEVEWVSVPIDGTHFSEIEVPRLLQESDLFINHPKLKTHGKTFITCGLKNMFGFHRAKDKGPLHRFLDEAIVDINMALRPHMTIVDADLCVEGNRGPTQGFPKRLGFFMGGADPVAVDAFCARLMGLPLRGIGHIQKAAQKKLGSLKYEVVGDLSDTDLRPYRFQFSRGNYYLMQVVRKVFSWSAAG